MHWDFFTIYVTKTWKPVLFEIICKYNGLQSDKRTCYIRTLNVVHPQKIENKKGSILFHQNRANTP